MGLPPRYCVGTDLIGYPSIGVPLAHPVTPEAKQPVAVAGGDDAFTVSACVACHGEEGVVGEVVL